MIADMPSLIPVPSSTVLTHSRGRPIQETVAVKYQLNKAGKMSFSLHGAGGSVYDELSSRRAGTTCTKEVAVCGQFGGRTRSISIKLAKSRRRTRGKS